MNSTSTHSIVSPQTIHSNASVHIPFIPYLDIQLPVTFALKLLLDIIGALVNACLWAVCYRKQQTDPNAVGLIIIQLVSCWLLLDIMVFPIHDIVTFLYLFGYHVPNDYCKFNLTAARSLTALANWTEVCLAVNRALAICLPHHYSRICSRKVIVRMLLTTWLITGIVGPPGAYGWGGQFRVFYINQCVYVAEGRLGSFFVAMTLFLPLVLSGTCCAVILVKSIMVQRQQRSVVAVEASTTKASGVGSKTQRTANLLSHRRVEIALVLFTSFLWGAACGLPFVVIMSAFGHLFLQYPMLTVWIHLILDGQYSVTPFTMLWLSTDYRNIAWSLFVRRPAGHRAGPGYTGQMSNANVSVRNDVTGSAIQPSQA